MNSVPRSNTPMGAYLMRKNMRGSRRRSGIDTLQSTRVSNFDSGNMVNGDLVSVRQLEGGDQGGYFHDSKKADMSEAFSNTRNQIVSGRSGNISITGYDRDDKCGRAKLERRRK